MNIALSLIVIKHKEKGMKKSHALIIVLATSLHTNVMAQDYTLSIQPVLSKGKLITTYQPLADYLTDQTGHKITIKAYRDYLTYWQKMKTRNNFDIVLDAAHFTDYRIQHYDYTALAKAPGTVSYSLVTHTDVLVSKPEELILKKVATIPSPGLGGVRLYEIYNNPSRLPIEVTVNNSQEAIEAIANGNVDAAIIPTSLVSRYEFLNTVMTTEPVPQIAISSSPTVPMDVAKSIQKALTNANANAKGKLMLDKIDLPEFVSTDSKEYSGYSKLLKNVPGYKLPMPRELAANN